MKTSIVPALLILTLMMTPCAYDAQQNPAIRNIYNGDTIVNNIQDSGRHDPVFRSVVQLDNIKEKTLGTAFIFNNINNNSYALTAQHLCTRRGATFRAFAVPDENNNREEFFAKAVYVSDEEADVCIVRIYDTAKQFFELKFSDTAPKIGDRVMTIGAAVGVFPAKTEGYVIGYDLLGEELEARKDGQGAKMLLASIPVAGGSSGGPVYNNEFKIVGMLIARHSRYHHSSVSVHVETLKIHLRSYFDRVGPPRLDEWAP
jgi:S1-C subfamily serine protease